MSLKLFAFLLIGIWLILLMLGKSGFIHTLALFAAAVLILDIVCVLRAKVTK